jgi:hypothetical protein
MGNKNNINPTINSSVYVFLSLVAGPTSSGVTEFHTHTHISWGKEHLYRLNHADAGTVVIN